MISILKEMKRQNALDKAKRDFFLADAYQLEERQVEYIISKALDSSDQDGHWQDYEDLKEIASQIVGFDASHSQLQTTRHYEAMIDFINWLLVLSRKPVIVERDRGVEELEELA